MLSYQTMDLLLDERDAFEIANVRRWMRDKSLPSLGESKAADAGAKDDSEHRYELSLAINEALAFTEERFASLHAGDRFVPRDVMKRNAEVRSYEAHELLVDFEAIIVTRYKRHGITYLTFANGEVMSSEVFVVSDWTSLGRGPGGREINR